MKMVWKSFCVLLASALGSFLAAPARADLSGTITVVEHYVGLAPGNSVPLTATCPVNMVALSGALHLSHLLKMMVTTLGPIIGGQTLYLSPDGSGAAPNGWYGMARNDDTWAQDLHLAVVCAPISGVTSVVTSHTVNSASYGYIDAVCPVGTVATGGGVATQYSHAMIVTSSSPTFNGGSYRTAHQPVGTAAAPKGWFGASHNTSSSVGGTMKVAAVCAPLSNVSTIIASALVANNNSSGAEAECPGGSFLIGGGIDLENLLNMSVTTSAFKYPAAPEFLWQQSTGQHGVASAWLGHARNDSGSIKEIKTAAICAPIPLGPPPRRNRAPMWLLLD